LLFSIRSGLLHRLFIPFFPYLYTDMYPWRVTGLLLHWLASSRIPVLVPLRCCLLMALLVCFRIVVQQHDNESAPQ